MTQMRNRCWTNGANLKRIAHRASTFDDFVRGNKISPALGHDPFFGDMTQIPLGIWDRVPFQKGSCPVPRHPATTKKPARMQKVAPSACLALLITLLLGLGLGLPALA